jgi:hypothetical protein
MINNLFSNMLTRSSMKLFISYEFRLALAACSVHFTGFLAIMLHWEQGKCIANARELDLLVLRFDEHEKLVVPALKGHLKGTHIRICSAHQSHFDRRSNNYIYSSDDCGEAFEALELLDRHLVSPFHDVEAFRCPGSRSAFLVLEWHAAARGEYSLPRGC